MKACCLPSWLTSSSTFPNGERPRPPSHIEQLGWRVRLSCSYLGIAGEERSRLSQGSTTVQKCLRKLRLQRQRQSNELSPPMLGAAHLEEPSGGRRRDKTGCGWDESLARGA